MEVSSGHKARPFECSTCLKRFTRQENLKRHAHSVHQNANAKAFKCTYCTVTLSREDLRTRHIRKCHPSEPLIIDFTSLQKSSVDLEADVDTNHAIPESNFNVPNQRPMLCKPQYITSYFENVHPRMPLLHEPTFNILAEPETLLLAIGCLGSIYHPESSSPTTSNELFDSSYFFLKLYVQEDHSRFQETWVMQAFVLLETFAIYICDDNLFLVAQNLHRDLVDAARKYHLLQDSIAVKDSENHDDQNDETTNVQGLPNERADSNEIEWQNFIKHESQKRIIYSLYYLDAQLAIMCNVKPLLSALEIKYELPCRDDLWSAPTLEKWTILNHQEFFSFNEEDDDNGNPQPRPAHGLLYESMMHLIHPGPKGRSLKLLWYSPFAALILVMQIQMMARELTTASVFLYTNVRRNDSRHNLTMIAEEHRGPVSQALNNLADLIPGKKSTGIGDLSDFSDHEIGHNRTLWHSVWISWYYTCIALSHQDALLSTGIVECNLPAAISTTWELGKPRAKKHRDVYEDRDVFRIVNNLEQIIYMLNSFPTGLKDAYMTNKCLEDPFVTILGFKACMMGWRVVRLMMLDVDKRTPSNSFGTAPTRAVLLTLMNAVNSRQNIQSWSNLDDLPSIAGNSYEIQYLTWAGRLFSERNTWPIGGWMTAVLQESLDETTEDHDKTN